jgi:predicted O-methyltransferase YrrM
MFRRYLGFELKPEYAKQADRNLKDAEASVGDLFAA